MKQKRTWFTSIAACLIGLSLAVAASAQLASRPAEEWKNTLEQSSRVDGLKIGEIVGRLGLKPGQVVADLGAGTGLFSTPLAKAVAPAGKVYAVEIDKGFLPLIEAKAKESNLSNVKTVLGEFTDPKLPATDVDVAFMHDVLHHVEDRPGYLKKAGGYVKRGGRFVIIDYQAANSPHRDQPNLIVSEEQVTGWMKAAGFGKVDKVDLFPDKYFLIFSRTQ
jgi:ubiquinone/menaquinone biosynthesis C-methylase UbiE